MPRKLKKFESDEKALRSEIPAAEKPARKGPKMTRADAERRMAEHTAREQAAAAAAAKDAAKVEELKSGLDVEAMAEHEDALKELRAKRTARRQAKAEAKAEEIHVLHAVKKATAKQRFLAGERFTEKEKAERDEVIGDAEAEGSTIGEAYSESTLAPEDVMARRGLEKEAERYLQAKKEKELEPEITITEATPEERAEIEAAAREEEMTPEVSITEATPEERAEIEQAARAETTLGPINLRKLQEYQAEKYKQHESVAAKYHELEKNIFETYGHYPEAIDLNPSLVRLPEGSGMFNRVKGWFRNLAGQPADPELGKLLDEWRQMSAEVLQLSRDAGIAKADPEAVQRAKERDEKQARLRQEENYEEREAGRKYRKDQGMMRVEEVNKALKRAGGGEEEAERLFFNDQKSLEQHSAEAETSWEALTEHLSDLGKKAAELQAELSVEKGMSADRIAEIKSSVEELQKDFDALPEAGGASEEYNDNHQVIQSMLDSASRMALKQWHESQEQPLGLTAGQEAAKKRGIEVLERVLEEPTILSLKEFRAENADAITAAAKQIPDAEGVWKAIQDRVETIGNEEELKALEEKVGTEDVATAYVLKLAAALENPSSKKDVEELNEALHLPNGLNLEQSLADYQQGEAAVSEQGEKMENVRISPELAEDIRKQKRRTNKKKAA
jgi:hypothetical protein